MLADVHRREFRQLWAQLITRAYTPPPAKPRRRSSIVRTEGALAGGVGIASLLAAWDPSEQEQLRGLVTAVRSHNTTASRRRNGLTLCVNGHRCYQVLLVVNANATWVNARKMLVRPAKFLVRLLQAVPSQLKVGHRSPGQRYVDTAVSPSRLCLLAARERRGCQEAGGHVQPRHDAYPWRAEGACACGWTCTRWY